MQSKDIAGTWHNEHGSEIAVEVLPDGRIMGRFHTAIGFGTDETFPVIGFVANNMVVFSASFEKYGSLTSWVGHLVTEGEPRMETVWQMAVEVPAKHGDDIWKSIWSGADEFRRGPAPREPRNKGTPPIPPVWWE